MYFKMKFESLNATQFQGWFDFCFYDLDIELKIPCACYVICSCYER